MNIIIGPAGAGKTTLVAAHGLDLVENTLWQRAIGRASTEGWPDEKLVRVVGRYRLPRKAVACLAAPGVLRERCRRRHVETRGQRLDWSPLVAPMLETTARVIEVLRGKSVPVLSVRTDRDIDVDAIRDFLR